MIPILFPSTQSIFYTNAMQKMYQGKGRLADAISCVITEELNGIFELELTYPANGERLQDILDGGIIGALYPFRPNSYNPVQRRIEPFDIYKTELTADGMLTVNARHISYRLRNHIVNGVTTNQNNLASLLKAGATPAETFFDWSNLYFQLGGITFSTPEVKSLREFFLDDVYSVQSVLGYEFQFSQNVILAYPLPNGRGIDTHITVRIGKNIRDGSIQTDSTDSFNAIVPFWMDDNVKVVCNPLLVEPTTPITPVKAIQMDFTQMIENQPTAAELETAARNYLDTQQPWINRETTHIEFSPRWQAAGQMDIPYLEAVTIGDTVDVYWEEGNMIGTKLRVVKCEYDSLEESYNSLGLGDLEKGYVLTGEW